MIIETWPFLISRNKAFDYTLVVAPPFMTNRTGSTLLLNATSGDLTDEKCAIYREVHGSQVGDFSLVFRVIPADSQHLGLKEKEALKDQFGRPIRLIEGFVIQSLGFHLKISLSDFMLAHQQMKNDYRSFWDAEVRTPLVKSSKAFILQSNPNVNDVVALQTLAPLIMTTPVVSKPIPPPNPRPVIHPEDTSVQISRPEEQLVEKGDILCAEGYYEDAYEIYKQALKIKPDYATAHSGLGNTFYHLGHNDQAMAAFKTALKFDGSNALAYNGLGNLSYSEKHYEEALIFYNKATQVDPDCAIAYSNKAGTLHELGREEESRQAFEQSLNIFEKNIQHQPDNPSLYYYQSQTLKVLGRSKDAKEAEHRARKIKHQKNKSSEFH